MLVRDLPAQPTSFVGRKQELTEILGLLDNPDCRLLTLIGPGGIGKTRLSLEAAALIRDHQNGGFQPSTVYFVPLQPLDSPARILSALAEALRLQFYSGDPKEQLVDYLRPKALMLVLDNFEHLIDGADLIAELLANAPQIKILVTSRETLNLREEWLYQVKGMGYPDGEEAADADTYSAVRLFVQSARRVRPDFSLSDELSSVLRICRLVEGMPLALEMTAAWLRRLPTSEIVQQLERGLDILESPARNVPARHRSIRAVFEHSWKLLTEQERAVFAKLSVFRGGFRREAAEAISGARLGLLSTLVDKSLLLVDSSGRYDLHELLRQYGEEKLNAQPEVSRQTHDDHCVYYMNFLDHRSIDMMAHMALPVVTEITADLKNIQAGVNWMLEYKDVEQYDEAATCLLLFYQFRCLYDDAENLSGRIVAKLRQRPPGAMLAGVLVMQGWFVELRDQDYPRAVALMEEGREIGRSLGEKVYHEDSLLRLSDVAVKVGDYERARQLAQECVDYWSTFPHHWSSTFELAHLGYVHYLLGNHIEAKTLIEEAVRVAEENNVPSGVSDAKNYLGQVQIALQDYQGAKQTYVDNLSYSKPRAYLKGIVLALIGAGEAANLLGTYQEAREYLCEALKTGMESNQIPYVLQALTVMADLLRETGQPELAARHLALVVDHHANYETRSRATRLLAELELQLSPEIVVAAVDAGGCDTLEDVVHNLLNPQPVESHQPQPAVLGPLGEREVEILQLVANGLSNREIADQLFLATGTVKWYLSEIYGKLYVTSRTQAIARARELNLLA